MFCVAWFPGPTQWEEPENETMFCVYYTFSEQLANRIVLTSILDCCHGYMFVKKPERGFDCKAILKQQTCTCKG